MSNYARSSFYWIRRVRILAGYPYFSYTWQIVTQMVHASYDSRLRGCHFGPQCTVLSSSCRCFECTGTLAIPTPCFVTVLVHFSIRANYLQCSSTFHLSFWSIYWSVLVHFSIQAHIIVIVLVHFATNSHIPCDAWEASHPAQLFRYYPVKDTASHGTTLLPIGWKGVLDQRIRLVSIV